MNLVAQSSAVAMAASVYLACTVAQAQDPERPNFLIIWGDDIGYWNVSYNSRGMMGYETPNIDRIADEGVIFTGYYGEQNCTAGRAAFITGQSGIRTGLLKVGLPGAEVGLQAEDPTPAELLKPLGYHTGQFGKSHLGDRNESLPTVHGRTCAGRSTRARAASSFTSDDGKLIGLRYDRYKAVFAEQRAHRFDVWRYPFVKLRAPKIFDLRMDPFERGDTDSNNWNEWWSRHAFMLVPAQAFVAERARS
jgi:arylsulfatase A-like enzyme